MAIEEKLKGLLGEQAFHIAVLQHQIEELQKRLAELQQQPQQPGAQPRAESNGNAAIRP